MKRLILVLFFVSFIAQVQAADIYDEAVKVYETPTDIVYYGQTYYAAARGTGDSLTTHFTQFFEILNCNDNDAYIFAYCSDVAGTEDVNILAYYSMDTDTAIVSSLNSGVIIDQLTTAPAGDTLNVYGGAQDELFGGARWMRLGFDGQTGNTNCYVYWWVSFKKDNADVNYKNHLNRRDHKAGAGVLALLLILGGLYFKKRK
jgi:hypothetical protein